MKIDGGLLRLPRGAKDLPFLTLKASFGLMHGDNATVALVENPTRLIPDVLLSPLNFGDGRRFLRVVIITTDEPGVSSRTVRAISTSGLNIAVMESTSDAGRAMGVTVFCEVPALVDFEQYSRNAITHLRTALPDVSVNADELRIPECSVLGRFPVIDGWVLGVDLEQRLNQRLRASGGFALRWAIVEGDSTGLLVRFRFATSGTVAVEVEMEDIPGRLRQAFQVIADQSVNILSSLLRRGASSKQKLVFACESSIPRQDAELKHVLRSALGRSPFHVTGDLRLWRWVYCQKPLQKRLSKSAFKAIQASRQGKSVKARRAACERSSHTARSSTNPARTPGDGPPVGATPVFVWRSGQPPRGNLNSRCRYCQSQLQRRIPGYEEMDEQLRTMSAIAIPSLVDLADAPHEIWDAELSFPLIGVCDFCGWWINVFQTGNVGYTPTLAAALLQFDINDSQLAIRELRSHLSTRFSDVFRLAPRRFEELVGDVYRCLGWEVSLTKQSRDGGVDLVCLKKSTGEECLVECKRYRAGNRVGIAAVDRLLGASFHFQSNGVRLSTLRAVHLVTSSEFTQPALDAQVQIRSTGIDLELRSGHELLRLLRVYADPDLTPKDVEKLHRFRKRRLLDS